MKYTFGYIVNNLSVTFGTFYENTVATTQLPFSDAVETFFEVCDNNNACTKVKGEENIASNDDYKYTSEEIEFKLREFQSSLKRSEYKINAFNAAVIFLLTQHKFSSDDSIYETRMLGMLKNQLSILKSSESSGFIHQQNVVEFIKMSKNLMGIMKVSDESFVEDLLSLTETFNKSSQRNKRSTFSQKSTMKVVSHDTNYMKDVLELSGMLLNSDNSSIADREKENFVKKVHGFVGSLCQDQNLNTHSISSKHVTFEVTKVFSPQLFADPQNFPGKEKSSILFTSNLNFGSKYVCFAKIKFLNDMFDSSVSEAKAVYEAIIIERDENAKVIRGEDFSDFVNVELEGNVMMTCEIFKDNKWSEDCMRQWSNATRISCKCKTNSNNGILLRAVKIKKKLVTESPESTTKQETPFTFLPTRTTQKFEVTSTKPEPTATKLPTLATTQIQGASSESKAGGKKFTEATTAKSVVTQLEESTKASDLTTQSNSMNTMVAEKSRDVKTTQMISQSSSDSEKEQEDNRTTGKPLSSSPVQISNSSQFQGNESAAYVAKSEFHSINNCRNFNEFCEISQAHHQVGL